MDACAPDRSNIAREVLSYLSAHPDARDTLEGIGQGWLAGKTIKPSPTLLKEVLSDLVTQGLIEAHREKDGTTRYSSHKKQQGGKR
jgi:DNA-binding PadR family transcriptional regulator